MNKSIIWILLAAIVIILLILIFLLFGSRLPKKRKQEESFELPDYNQYDFSLKEIILYYGIGSGIAFVLAQVFYDNFFLSLIVVLIYLFVMIKWPSIIKKGLIEKRKDKLRLQFKDALQAIVSELSAGKSFLNILREGMLIENLIMLHGEDSYIVREFQKMSQATQYNVTEEDMLRDFANRADINDIASFVDVFTICRKQGGNINEVARNTANVIIEKMNLNEEIKTIVSQKKQEQKIMTVLPLGIIIVLRFMAADYMEPLYTTVGGRIAMTAAAIVIVCANYISKKIMSIEV